LAGYWSEDNILETIANVARSDGPLIPVWIEQEPAASGKITVAAVKKYFKQFPELQSHTVSGLDVKKVGDRVLAANLLWFNVAADGRMYMKKASWNDKTLKQIDGFTIIEHDDRVTSVTNAMFVLNPYKIWRKVPFVSL
jgi:phage terminase large subunit-like protein